MGHEIKKVNIEIKKIYEDDEMNEHRA